MLTKTVINETLKGVEVSPEEKKHGCKTLMIINAGKPKITINKKTFFASNKDSVFIPKGSIHRIENIYDNPVQIIEIQTGSILKENDIVRYQDIYGRVK